MKLRFSLPTLGLAASLLFVPNAVQGEGVRGTTTGSDGPQASDDTERDLEVEVKATRIIPEPALPKPVPRSFGSGNIVGGTLASQNEFKWFAAPEAATSSQYCGASLIHSDILLTAAGCETQFAVGKKVFVGAYQPNSAAYGAQERTVSAIRKHPAYNQQTYQNNFMLVLLDTPVLGITPVVLNAQPTVPNLGDVLTLMGFGWVNQQSGLQPSLLVKADLSPVATAACQAQYNNFILADGSSFNVNPTTMMCGGAVNGGVGPCVGDVGSPLVTASGVQVGIVSFGIGCGSVSYSSVYSRISGAKQWIDDNTCSLSKSPHASCGGGGGSKKVLMSMHYDSAPHETTFELKQGNNILFSGPAANQRGPNQVWHYDFGFLQSGLYELLVKDSACNGQTQLVQGGQNVPRFEVYETWADTGASSLATGPVPNGPPAFTCQFSLTFCLGDTQCGGGVTERCANGVGSGLSGDHCVWLTHYTQLCKAFDIAKKCPNTCNVCPQILSFTGVNQPGNIEMGPQFGIPNHNCNWLAAQADKVALCERTSIAFHCPQTCATTLY